MWNFDTHSRLCRESIRLRTFRLVELSSASKMRSVRREEAREPRQASHSEGLHDPSCTIRGEQESTPALDDDSGNALDPAGTLAATDAAEDSPLWSTDSPATGRLTTSSRKTGTTKKKSECHTPLSPTDGALTPLFRSCRHTFEWRGEGTIGRSLPL